MLTPKTRLDLQRARKDVAWIEDDDLPEVESKSRVGAALLGFFTWGGGRIYVGDLGRGLAAIGALVGWAALSSVLPAALGPLVFTAAGTVGALWAFDGAKRVNRFVATRDELHLREGAGPAAYRLLAGAAAADPSLASALPAFGTPATGAHADTVDRLRKLAALHHAGVINEAELRERKIDLFTSLGVASAAELDDLLFALLPLRHEGVLDDDDFEFLKQVAPR